MSDISFISADYKGFSPRGEKAWMDKFANYFSTGMVSNGIGYVAVYGAIGHGFWDFYSTDYQTIQANLEAMEQNKEVENIVLLINSPGGMCMGIQDTCNYIKSLSKPTYAYVHGMACSAAYAIATSCKKVLMSSDAETGCCGAYANAVEHDPKFLKEKMGILSMVFRSKNAPKKNLSVFESEEAKEEMQKEVDRLGDEYLSLVAENRGVSVEEAEKTFGQGSVVTSEYALENHMVDAICTIEEAIESILNNPEDEENITPSDEGVKEEDMDLTSMTSEQRRDILSQLEVLEPSFFDERDKATASAEKTRIQALNSLRNGSASVDAIVDAALEDGRTDNEIALDIVKAMKESAKANLNSLVEDTLDVNTPAIEDGSNNPYVIAADKMNKEE